MSSTAELNADFLPTGILDILQDFLQFHTDRDDTNRVGVSFTEYGPDAGNLLGSGERNVLGVNSTVLSDILSRLGFDLLELGV